MKSSLAKSRYKDALQVYEDLNLVFLNALFYNEDGSQIAKDAKTLKVCLRLNLTLRYRVLTFVVKATIGQRMA